MKNLTINEMVFIKGGSFNWKDFGIGICQGVTVGAGLVFNPAGTVSAIINGTGVGCLFL